LVMGGLLALGWRWSVRGLGIACLLIAVSMWVVAAVYLTVVPFTFRAVQDPVVMTGIKKGLVKALAQFLVYPLAMLWLAGIGWWGTRLARRA